MILITALLIPLWLHVRPNHESTNTNTTATATATATATTTTTTTNTNATTNTNTNTNGTIQPSFSGYNLYLVYLAIPDMILNIFLLWMYGSFVNQKYNPIFSIIIVDWTNDPLEGAFVIAC
jgi:hypothetical protein